jgi:hypothetical protein
VKLRHSLFSWRIALPGALLLCGLLHSNAASAKQEYYDALLETGTCADCRLCHTTPQGNAASIDLSKPFAATMEPEYLGKLPPMGVDSDGDTFPDLQELQQMGDPNDPEIGINQFDCPGADYGCARVAPSAPRTDLTALTAALLVALMLTRRLFSRRALTRRGY